MASKQLQLSLGHVYAHALFDVASQQKAVTEVEEELLALREMVRAEPRLKLFLESPVIAAKTKHKVIRELLAQFHQPVVNFICLVVDRQRMELLDEIIASYHELANMAQGISEMQLESARALMPEEIQRLTATMEAKMRRKVVIRQTEHPELLGGFILRRGDLQWDASVSRRLRRLTTRMAESKEGIEHAWKD